MAAKHLSSPHNYNQVSREVMYNFLNEHLKLGQPSPVKEKPFEPIEPKDLSVYDAEHPRPADALDAAGAAQAADRIVGRADWPSWRRTRREYAKVLRTALRVMLCEAERGAAGQGAGAGRAG